MKEGLPFYEMSYQRVRRWSLLLNRRGEERRGPVTSRALVMDMKQAVKPPLRQLLDPEAFPL
jgi:hypothetical protein